MIIVNADDLGRSKSICDSIFYGIENKLINRTSLMVNMPFVNYAVIEAKKRKIKEVIGLHLTLDEGMPLTENIKNIELFCDKDGKFNGTFRKYKKYYFSLKDKYIEMACAEEINCQMQCYKDLDLSLLHIDSHHHVHTIPSILKILLPIAKDNGFKSMRIRFNLQDNSFIKQIRTKFINKYICKNFETTDYFCDSTFLKQKPEDGFSYEIMCHPDCIDNQYVDVIGNMSFHNYLDLSHLSYLLK